MQPTPATTSYPFGAPSPLATAATRPSSTNTESASMTSTPSKTLTSLINVDMLVTVDCATDIVGRCHDQVSAGPVAHHGSGIARLVGWGPARGGAIGASRGGDRFDGSRGTDLRRSLSTTPWPP